MKTTEVNKELIGRRCECIFTGLMVTGVIEDTEENEHTIEVKVRFDHPHQWGDDLYNDVWAWGRKTDEFGTLHHLQLLEDKETMDALVAPQRIESFGNIGYGVQHHVILPVQFGIFRAILQSQSKE